LESGAGIDSGNSQLNCGVAIGNTKPNVYAVYSN